MFPAAHDRRVDVGGSDSMDVGNSDSMDVGNYDSKTTLLSLGVFWNVSHRHMTTLLVLPQEWQSMSSKVSQCNLCKHICMQQD